MGTAVAFPFDPLAFGRYREPIMIDVIHPTSGNVKRNCDADQVSASPSRAHPQQRFNIQLFRQLRCDRIQRRIDPPVIVQRIGFDAHRV
jgi:hypothetical protein